MTRWKYTAEERFWQKVRVTDTCWEWRGSINKPTGYSTFWDGERKSYGHIFSYRLFNGAIPEGLEIDHRCRNRGCVRPSHLEAVTHAVNISRSPIHPCVRNRAKTHCPRGHAYDEANTRLYRGYRNCRACQRERQRGRRT